MTRVLVVMAMLGCSLSPQDVQAQIGLGSLPDLSGLLRQVERDVRAAAAPAVSQLVGDAVKAQSVVETAQLASNAAEIAEAQRLLDEKEKAVEAEESRIRSRIEQRAILRVESELPKVRTVPLRVSRITLLAALNALFSRRLAVQPVVFDNYVFVETDPMVIPGSGSSEAVIRLVVLWARGGQVLQIRYAALERRLRSPQPRPTTDAGIEKLADSFAEGLAQSIVSGKTQ